MWAAKVPGMTSCASDPCKALMDLDPTSMNRSMSARDPSTALMYLGLCTVAKVSDSASMDLGLGFGVSGLTSIN